MGRFQKTKRWLFAHNLVPPHKWRRAATVAVALIFGIGAYLVYVSNAASYLSEDPQACVNCHIMTPQYITWKHSSHREVASCNDCHVPHNNVINKYFFKAKDGLYHAMVFTARKEPQVIKALEPSIKVIQSNCIHCHENQITDARTSATVPNHFENRESRTCWECHRDVPHGKVKSLSSVGNQIEPIKEYKTEEMQVLPQWLQEGMKAQQQQKDEKKK